MRGQNDVTMAAQTTCDDVDFTTVQRVRKATIFRLLWIILTVMLMQLMRVTSIVLHCDVKTFVGAGYAVTSHIVFVMEVDFQKP